MLGCDSVIVTGTTTSGCVRATVLDAFSLNYHVAIAEEGCFDRSQASHAINLCDMNAKYAAGRRGAHVPGRAQTRPVRPAKGRNTAGTRSPGEDGSPRLIFTAGHPLSTPPSQARLQRSLPCTPAQRPQIRSPNSTKSRQIDIIIGTPTRRRLRSVWPHARSGNVSHPHSRQPRRSSTATCRPVAGGGR